MTLDKAVKQMRGEPGTKVTLTIFRKSDDRTFPGHGHARDHQGPERR